MTRDCTRIKSWHLYDVVCEFFCVYCIYYHFLYVAVSDTNHDLRLFTGRFTVGVPWWSLWLGEYTGVVLCLGCPGPVGHDGLVSSLIDFFLSFLVWWLFFFSLLIFLTWVKNLTFSYLQSKNLTPTVGGRGSYILDYLLCIYVCACVCMSLYLFKAWIFVHAWFAWELERIPYLAARRCSVY